MFARKRLPPKQLNAHHSEFAAPLGLFADTRLAAAFGDEPVLVHAFQPAPLLAEVFLQLVSILHFKLFAHPSDGIAFSFPTKASSPRQKSH